MRAATAARLVVGTACLGSPRAVLRSIAAPDHGDPRVQAVARILGLRLVVQGLVDLARPGRSRGLDVAVELTHAVSMLPVAARWRGHRRAAWVSAAVAGVMAVTDLLERPD